MKNEFVIDSLVHRGWFSAKNFIDTSLCDDLLSEAQIIELKRAQIGKGATIQLNNEIRTDEISWLSDNGDSIAQKKFLDEMNQLKNEINQSLFLGLREYECHFAKYSLGGFYKKHLDQHKNSKARFVSTITYLNNPEGGELIIYQKDHPDILEAIIEPNQGTFVCFLSEEIYHEVRPTRSERFSLTGWFRK
jgi:SM-20-related protein